jgi:hypothetical protein
MPMGKEMREETAAAIQGQMKKEKVEEMKL